MSKRKKHVYSSTDNLCHEFIHQEDTRNLRCSASSISSENGDTIYSYDRIIGKKLIHACGKKPVILTLFSYPYLTTSKHLSALRCAIDSNKYTECRLFFENYDIHRINTVEELPIHVIHNNVKKWIGEFTDTILKRESIVTGPRIKDWRAKNSIHKVLVLLKILSVKYTEYKTWCENRKKELDLLENKSSLTDKVDEKTLFILLPLLEQIERLIINDEAICDRDTYDTEYYAFCYSLVDRFSWITPEKVEELDQKHKAYLTKKEEEKKALWNKTRKTELKKIIKLHRVAERFVEKAEEQFMEWASTTNKDFNFPIERLSRAKFVQGRLITSLGINILVNDKLKENLRLLWIAIKRAISNGTNSVNFVDSVKIENYPVYRFGVSVTRYETLDKYIPVLAVGCHNIPYVDLYLIAKRLEFDLSDLPVPTFNFSEYIDPKKITSLLTIRTSDILKQYPVELITECEEELKNEGE
jgi:hypothetical protein